MIIINQNEEIINFDTIDFLDFEYHENGCCAINANFAHCIVTLGIYETEERAKEIIKEIKDLYIYITIYNNNEQVTKTRLDIIKAINTQENMQLYCYEMPKE